MRRYFLRVYIGIAIALFIGASATLFMVNRQLESLRRDGFKERLIGQMSMMRQMLKGTSDAETRARQMANWSGRQNVEIRSFSGLVIPKGDLARIRYGETVVLFEGDLPVVYGALSETEVLVLTLLPRPGGFFTFGFLRPPDVFLLSMLAVVLFLIGVAIYVLIRPLERRIYALTGVAERFGQGDLRSRALVDNQDAIANLARTFNGMAERIEALVESQKDLLQAVSHEFRTPLARLFFVVDEARDADTTEEKDVHLLRVQRSLDDLSELVEELLAYARLDREAAKPEVEPVSIHPILWEMPDLVMELRQDISVEVQCEQVKLRALKRYFRRALQNLVTNAVRHTKTGIWISGCVDGNVIHVVVEDDGVGVPADQREKIFEPFARLDKSRNSKLGGTGLGLAIVKRIMDLHQGKVSVDDSPHGGARFTLSFAMHGARSLLEIKL